ncbi:hypothetical protein [Bradyrhizobium liaoningense]|uniref:hypothetical protein n=1 Tax=Bradyrhizobium liaoningense TaxID=43992 RepID=UPI003D9BA275
MSRNIWRRVGHFVSSGCGRAGCDRCRGIDFAVGRSPPSVAPSVGGDIARDLEMTTLPYGIRDLGIGNEFLRQDLIAEISAEERRDHKVIVLMPTPALRQLCAIRALARCDRFVIRLEGLATDFETLRMCRDRRAIGGPAHCIAAGR